MSNEIKDPTPDEKLQTANMMKNIANLIRAGLFAGSNGAFAAHAIQWLDTGANFMLAPAPAADPVKLEVVPDVEPEIVA